MRIITLNDLLRNAMSNKNRPKVEKMPENNISQNKQEFLEKYEYQLFKIEKQDSPVRVHLTQPENINKASREQSERLGISLAGLIKMLQLRLFERLDSGEDAVSALFKYETALDKLEFGRSDKDMVRVHITQPKSIDERSRNISEKYEISYARLIKFLQIEFLEENEIKF